MIELACTRSGRSRRAAHRPRICLQQGRHPACRTPHHRRARREVQACGYPDVLPASPTLTDAVFGNCDRGLIAVGARNAHDVNAGKGVDLVLHGVRHDRRTAGDYDIGHAQVLDGALGRGRQIKRACEQNRHRFMECIRRTRKRIGEVVPPGNVAFGVGPSRSAIARATAAPSRSDPHPRSAGPTHRQVRRPRSSHRRTRRSGPPMIITCDHPDDDLIAHDRGQIGRPREKQRRGIGARKTRSSKCVGEVARSQATRHRRCRRSPDIS